MSERRRNMVWSLSRRGLLQTQEPEKDGTPAEASVPPIKQR
jgi:hypothetical protein